MTEVAVRVLRHEVFKGFEPQVFRSEEFKTLELATITK
jgi:hypothetical protein